MLEKRDLVKGKAYACFSCQNGIKKEIAEETE
jgi:hypothetical protein